MAVLHVQGSAGSADLRSRKNLSHQNKGNCLQLAEVVAYLVKYWGHRGRRIRHATRSGLRGAGGSSLVRLAPSPDVRPFVRLFPSPFSSFRFALGT